MSGILTGGMMTPDQIALLIFVCSVGFNAIVCAILIIITLVWLKNKYKDLVKECKESKKRTALTPTAEITNETTEETSS